ncbi:keratin, type I cytoskeletal 9 [Panicum miliaceum]|uniref:Keratin, type I cytoskeletal 9 n=1 Tax=Panicum miliaceum TaxID=4540 RepID=A0A3L6TFZ5_PANMI|nr:keratin, type I cytoskeletal 9 [Panicum miliaceum]
MASYDGDEGTGRRGPSQHRPSGRGSGDLASSAKLVAEAAKLALQDHSLEKVDKGRVAGAAADLLHAASQYGKLEGKPVGGYLGKAEEYLHQYGRKEGGAGGGKHQGEEEGKYGKKPGGGHGGGSGAGHGGRYEEDDYKKKPSGHSGGRYEEEEGYKKTSGHSGGKYGKDEDDKKKKKHGDDESEGGGIGDYLKLAQGFMNKKDGEGESGGGMGDYLKLAEGFLKKR